MPKDRYLHQKYNIRMFLKNIKNTYIYEGFHDPIQKITGDAYHALCGIKTDLETDNMAKETKRFNEEDEKRYPTKERDKFS